MKEHNNNNKIAKFSKLVTPKQDNIGWRPDIHQHRIQAVTAVPTSSDLQSVIFISQAPGEIVYLPLWLLRTHWTMFHKILAPKHNHLTLNQSQGNKFSWKYISITQFLQYTHLSYSSYNILLSTCPPILSIILSIIPSPFWRNKEKAACRKYHFVSLCPLIITCESNINEVFVIP